MNGRGLLLAEAVRPLSESTFALVLRRVGEAQARKAPIQTFMEKFAAAYTPAVLVSALLVGAIPPAMGLGGASVWAYRALVITSYSIHYTKLYDDPGDESGGLACPRGGVHREVPGKTGDRRAPVAFHRQPSLSGRNRAIARRAGSERTLRTSASVSRFVPSKAGDRNNFV